MVLVLAVVASFSAGFLVAGLFFARSESAALEELRADVHARLAAHEQRLAIVEAEQAARDTLVADAVTKLQLAAKRIQTRLTPEQRAPENGESVLAMRNRLRGGP